MAEHAETFACFGSECTVIVSGAGAGVTTDAGAAQAVAMAKRRLEQWHRQFSRFEPASELSRLNADPRGTVPVSPMMGRMLEAALGAAESTGGLVDATLVGEIERAGYATDLAAPSPSLASALARAPERKAAGPHPSARWRGVDLDRRAGTVTRVPGVRFDSGGIAKGVFADELGALLADSAAFAVDCAGDILLGGRGGVRRDVHVASPFDGSTLHTFGVVRGGVATSGIGKRVWLDAEGSPSHHLLDPATGRPAFTGIVQVTALAPCATQAELASKAALLSGPDLAASCLTHGGVIVLDDGAHRVVKPRLAPERRATCTTRRVHAPARAR